MKHLLFSIGLLSALLPAIAVAQCPESAKARELLRKTPTGHYTKAVLQRVTDGIAKAKISPINTPHFDLADMHYMITIESIMYMLVDTDLRAVEYSRDLATITPCLHLDLAMMEAKMEEVRCEINEAYEKKSPGALRQLKSIANFLNERYRHLVQGALEPAHTDTDWVYYNEFDDPFEGWCCVLDLMECQIRQSDDCTEVKNGTGGFEFFDTKDACTVKSICGAAASGNTDPKYKDICPFDSNYLADNSTGFGCQIDLITGFAGGSFVAVNAEKEALIELVETRNSFLNDIAHIKDVTLDMDNLVDETMLNADERLRLQNFGAVASVAPKRVFGCNANVLPIDRPPNENNEGAEGLLTPGLKPSEEWGSIPTRGPFFFEKDQLSIWKRYFQLQHEWASQREYPNYIRKPDEFPDEDDREDTAKLDQEAFGIYRIPRDDFRNVWMAFHHRQATQEASILPKAQDAELEAIEAIKPLRPAMKRNIELVNNSNRGLRKFARNYAYFLRRSCIYRPCNEKLETIMKVLYSDECFPYANGAFQVKNDDEAPNEPSWQKCQDAVNNL
ncbi:MAG: hypothetical protein O3A80_05100 [bacterium]|nr:hypothetical protein [bacterium]